MKHEFTSEQRARGHARSDYSKMGVLGQQTLNARPPKHVVHNIQQFASSLGTTGASSLLGINRHTLNKLCRGQVVRRSLLRRVIAELHEKKVTCGT
jgi:hypothetical protein